MNFLLRNFFKPTKNYFDFYVFILNLKCKYLSEISLDFSSLFALTCFFVAERGCESVGVETTDWLLPFVVV